ncbi:hypothetical protein [Holdemanella porci]|uniref:hypothetical protein n=1 Tax=Holdemanella porci TaxID=2652276 RepID=UPI0038904300
MRFNTTALKANRIKEKAPHNHAVRKGMTKQDWDKMDEEMLPFVKELCEKIYTGNGERPKRVTINAITKATNWPNKRLNYLPKCKELVRTYSSESIEEYWAREIVFYYEKFRNESAHISWRRLRDITNMRRKDFDRCKNYLDNYTDNATADKIRRII